MVRELAREFQVTFIESLGLRRPELKLRDIRRVVRRIFPRSQKNSFSRSVPERVSVVSPKVIPIHTEKWRRLNKRLLRSQLASAQAIKDVDIYWTYSPVTYDMEQTSTTRIYHCVDLYGQFPGIDAKLIDHAEQRLVAAGFRAAGSSEVVVEHLESQGFKDVIYWPNVADTSAIARIRDREGEVARNGAIFAGNLSDKKVDFDLLEAVVKSGVHLALAGPIAEGGGESQKRVEELIRLGATYHGVLSLDELSAAMLRCTVGLIPYLSNSYTLGVSPLKTYEYLAAGLSVVATPLPGVTPIDAHVVTPPNSAAFVSSVKATSASPAASLVKARIQLANGHSWDARGAAARKLIHELGPRP
jgi:hypothetical protein